MNYKIITDYNSVDINRWEEFVKNHKDGNVFQTPEMYNVYKSENNYIPVLVVCIDNNDEIVGLIVSVIQKEFNGILGRLSSRAIIWGAPLVKDDNIMIFKLLLKEFDKIVKNKAVYTQIRNLWNVNIFKSVFEEIGYKYENHLNILVDLKKSEDDLWKEVSSRRRSQINKSERLGISIKIFNEPELIEESYRILIEVYKKAKLPLAGKEFFKKANMFLGEKGYLKFFGAFYEGKMVGVIYLLCYNKRTYEWYIGSNFEYLRMHPNDLIAWEIFKWSKNNNYTIFDFGGAGNPEKEYGVREYKKKFGGETLDLGRYIKIHKHFLMNISILGFKVWQMVKFGFKKH